MFLRCIDNIRVKSVVMKTMASLHKILVWLIQIKQRHCYGNLDSLKLIQIQTHTSLISIIGHSNTNINITIYRIWLTQIKHRYCYIECRSLYYRPQRCIKCGTCVIDAVTFWQPWTHHIRVADGFHFIYIVVFNNWIEQSIHII